MGKINSSIKKKIANKKKKEKETYTKVMSLFLSEHK